MGHEERRTVASRKQAWVRSLLTLVMVLLVFAPVRSSALTVKRDDLPKLEQRNRDYGGGGEKWCAPVATASCFQWLANHYDRDWFLKPFKDDQGNLDTEKMVKYLASMMNTHDTNGTTEPNMLRGIRVYVDQLTRPHDWKKLWTIDVYTDMSLNAPGGVTTHAHSAFSDVWKEFKAGEDVILCYEHSVLGKHAVVLQKLCNEKNSTGHYPGAIMNPWTGLYEDVGFYDENGRLKMWDYVAHRNVYFAVTVSPIPEPVTMLGLFLGVSGLVVYVRRTRTRRM